MIPRVSAGMLTACAAAAAIAAAPQQPVFRGTGDAVRVFATVMDHDGRLVPNLTKDVFEVRDDGKPQPITQFDNSPRPIRLIIMLDVSGSMHGNLELLRAASEQLLTRLSPDDLARLGSFGADVTIGPAFTHDVRELEAALPREIPPDAPTPLWRALNEAMNTFGDDADQRRVILVLTDGKDSGPTDLRHKAYSQADVIDRARNDDVMVYAVGMHSRPQQRAPGGMGGGMPGGLGAGGLREALLEDLPDPGLARVAEETGGGYTEIRYGEDLGAAFARVADELHSQYLIGYAPPKRDGKVHHIDVRVSGKGMKPRARRSYVAPK
ncbi:MAG TPA: VWA domain-containing protein [Vicinamibacterales bacterium]|nr:VWA domain-containing protein [Vicinamibacterales bacterium]